MSKGIKENQILAVVKKPGEAAYIEPLFPNKLKDFQATVEGFIETFTIATDLTLIINENGRIDNLPYNTTICGVDLFGTIIAVGVKGDEFASVKAANVPFVMDMLNHGGGML